MVALACVAGLWLLLTRTSFGRVVRAGVQNPDMVAALGISLRPYMTAVVTIAVGLAALAGTMMAPVTGVHPAMGAEILTFAFVVVVIGGLGSFWGVVLAALIVGVVRGLTAYAYPAGHRGRRLRPHGARPAAAPARPVRRAHRPVRVSGERPMSGTAEPLPLALPQRGPILRESRQLWAALAALIVLPFALDAIGLTLITATDVVIFALAVLGLNILVGWTGLISFGHGAWFGIGAYAVAILQTRLFPGDMALPLLGALAITALAAVAAGGLILRRRGVYFSLLTLAFTAMLYAIAFRWTDLTGGENGIGNLHRWAALQEPGAYYAAVSAIAFVVLVGLWRFRRSPMGSVLVAIRENEQRAGFLGYATNRYKLAAFVISATITGLAGALSAYNHRFASADPISIAFSGELLAMVVIGGMRSFLGPALGALFYILFREFLSIYTADWLLYFGLLFVAFIVFSPDGLVGIAARLLKPFRRVPAEGAAMSARRTGASGRVPARFIAEGRTDGPVLVADDIRKSFGPVAAVRGVSFAVADRTLHALIGPNGAGKTTAFNLLSGHVPAERRQHPPRRARDRGPGAARDHAGRPRPLVPDHQPVPGPVGGGEHPARGPGAPRRRISACGATPFRSARSPTTPPNCCAGPASPESSGPRPAASPTAASASSTWGWRWPPGPDSCSSTSRWPASRRPSASASAT